jgi:hypothetical protein
MSKTMELTITESEQAELEALLKQVLDELEASEARQQQHDLIYSRLRGETEQMRAEIRADLEQTRRILCGDS